MDLVEFEIKNIKELDLQADIFPNERPAIIFQGDVFEYEANFMRIKNLMLGKNKTFLPVLINLSIEFFTENVHIQSVNIRNGVRHFIVITGDGETNTLHIRQYELTSNTLDIINASSDFVSKSVIEFELNCVL